MADNKAQIVLDGDVSPLKRKLREAAGELKKLGTEGRDSVNGLGDAFGGLHSKVVNSLTGILSLGAIAMFVKSTKDAAVQAEASFRGLEAVANYAGVGIGNAMKAASELAADGMMTTAEASKALQNLLSRGYSVGQAVETLTRLKDAAAYNRAAHLSMGEAVVSASEGLKNENSILVDNAGVTKNVSVMWKEYAAEHGLVVANMTTAQKIQAEYNGVLAETEAQVGNAAKAMQGMQGQQAQLDVVTNNLMISVGQALTPAFIALAKSGTWVMENFGKPMLWAFSAIGISAGSVAVRIGILWDAIKSLNFSGVGAKFKAEIANYQSALQDAAAAVNAPMDQFEAAPDSGKRRPVGVPTPGKTDSGGADKTAKAAAKSLADRIKAEEDAYKEAVKIAESYEDQWQQEYKAVAAAARKSGNERMQIDLLQADGVRAAGLARIAELEAQSAHEVAMGAATQADHLAKLAQFNEMRLAEESRFLAAKREIALQDPDQNPVELERIEMEKAEIRRRHAALSMDIQRQQAIESRGIWSDLADSISGLWDKGVQALMNGTLTWKNAFQAIGAEMTKWFATQVVGAMVKDWLAGQVKKIAAMLGFTATEKGIQAAGAATTVGIKGAETTAVASMNAVQAGTGAAASQASIPYIGPILALAAMATIFAAVSAMGKKKSAMGGYDIPKGVNPMTQLHEEEMVLPKQYANAIRGMTKGGAGEGGESSGAQPMQVNISAVDARGVRDLFMGNQEALVDALKKAHRNSIR